MGVDIVFFREDLILSWRRAVDEVAAERRYLGRVTMPPFDPENPFGRQHVQNDWPAFMALDGEVVVGWADITPIAIPECAHRGTLGMGVVASHRGQGVGDRLLGACLMHAPRCGISKVELTVYTNNPAAIALYRKHGFTDLGVSRDYRRLDGETYDALLMQRFLS
jgi:ribosomal protein S18 acetylase RimI-like enzyme